MPELTKGFLCLECGHHLNGATSMEDQHILPNEGDISVCLYCATVAMFTDANGALRKIGNDEIKTFPNEVRKEVTKTQSAIMALRGSGGRK